VEKGSGEGKGCQSAQERVCVEEGVMSQPPCIYVSCYILVQSSVHTYFFVNPRIVVLFLKKSHLTRDV
jgi:hypothetical protein